MKTALAKAVSSFWLPLVAILLLGFSIFTRNLLETSLWSDEGWTIAASAEQNPLDIITDWVAEDVHPPLYFLGLNIWRRFTGDTIFELRYYSVLLSMIGIALAYRLGKSLFNARAGLLAALFYSLHDLIYVLTHEVRHYPQQVMLSVLVMWLYARFYKRPTSARGIAFALAGAALIYTHYWGGFVLLALAIHAVVTWLWPGTDHAGGGRRRPYMEMKPFVYAFAGIVLLYLPWLPVLVHQITLERPGGLPHALENSRWVYAVLTYQLIGIPELFWVVLACVGAMSAFARSRWTPSAMSLIPLLVAVLVPLLSIALNTIYPTLSFRALAVIVPAVIVLAAHGLSQFRAREQAVLIVFVLLFSLSTRSAGPIDRPDWPEIARYVVDHSDSTDVVLLENDTDEHAAAYYLRQFDGDIDIAYTESTRVLTPQAYPAYLDDVLDSKNGVWVMKLGWPPLSDIRPELQARGWVQTAPVIDYGMYNDRPILLWRLDRPPQDEPLTIFGDNLRLLTAESRVREDNIIVNMLWSPQVTPERDYTISVFVRSADGAVFRNVDSFPLGGLDGRSKTSLWQADNYYFDSRSIATQDLPPGQYQVGVQVYAFTDETFSAIDNLLSADCSADPACRFIIVGEVMIDS